jgi:hypothetical protein
MTTASISRLLRKQFPTIKSIRTGQGSMRGTTMVFGGTWETREAIAAAAAPFFLGQSIRVVL